MGPKGENDGGIPLQEYPPEESPSKQLAAAVVRSVEALCPGDQWTKDNPFWLEITNTARQGMFEGISGIVVTKVVVSKAPNQITISWQENYSGKPEKPEIAILNQDNGVWNLATLDVGARLIGMMSLMQQAKKAEQK